MIVEAYRSTDYPARGTYILMSAGFGSFSVTSRRMDASCRMQPGPNSTKLRPTSTTVPGVLHSRMTNRMSVKVIEEGNWTTRKVARFARRTGL